MNDIKISNKLLRLVFGCDKIRFKFISDKQSIVFKINKFQYVNNFDNEIKRYVKIVGSRVCDKYGELTLKINLHTFIHLAKIKAFECGYDIVEYSNSVKILGKKKFYPKVNYNRFTVELTIEALEWVAEKVGETK